MPIDPRHIEVEQQKDFENDQTFVFARFRASVAIVIDKFTLVEKPNALLEARAKAIALLAESPERYTVFAGQPSIRISLDEKSDTEKAREAMGCDCIDKFIREGGKLEPGAMVPCQHRRG